MTGYCAWGRSIGLADDRNPCRRPVTNHVHIHAGDAEQAFSVCEKHYVVILRLTDPHEVTT